MRRGFTLLELLIASAIVAVAAVVILGGFTAGIRVWERARELSGAGASARIAMAVARKDLCNMVPCRAASFQGAAAWVEIPAVVNEGVSNLWPGTIRYEFSRGAMKRKAKVMGEGGGVRESSEVLMSGAGDVAFSYGDAGDDGQGVAVWGREWMGRTNLPVAVKMAVRFMEGREQREIQQTVLLPRGYPVKDESGNTERR